MATRLKLASVVLVLAGVIWVVNHRTSEAQIARSMPNMPTQVLEGNYRVHYEMTFPDSTGAKGTEELVKRLEFHPSYLVLITQTGSGRVLPVHAIKHVTWEPA